MAPQIHKTDENACRYYSEYCDGSSRQWRQSSEQSEWLLRWSWPEAASAVTKLYEVRAEPEVEDAAADRIWHRINGQKKEPKGKKNALKVFIFWKRWRTWLRLCQLESDWVRISVPDGFFLFCVCDPSASSRSGRRLSHRPDADVSLQFDLLWEFMSKQRSKGWGPNHTVSILMLM